MTVVPASLPIRSDPGEVARARARLAKLSEQVGPVRTVDRDAAAQAASARAAAIRLRQLAYRVQALTDTDQDWP